MSTYAGDKLKRYVLREKITKFRDHVKVSQILDHLPCLTPSDREEIEAKEQNKGNLVAVPLLLKCLTRRENWAVELISALEACEAWDLAADLRRLYDSLNIQSKPKPNAPAARVHLPPPQPNSQAAVVLPPLAPSEPAAQVSPPPAAFAQPETPAQSESETTPSLATEASAKAELSSDPAPQAPQSPPMQAVHPQATPPASPETPHHPTTTTSPSPPPVHQEPEESSDVDLQVVSGDMGPGTDEGSDGDSEVSVVSSEQTPDPEPPVKPLVKLHAVASTLQPHAVRTATPEVSPPQSPSPSQTGSDETDESTSTIMTPDKCPVQETVPPKDQVFRWLPLASAVLEPEEHSDPIATQITENCQHTVSTGTSTLPADGQNASFIDEDDDRQLSKPGQLLSYQPEPAPQVSNGCQVEPGIKEASYSGTSSRLEMSESVLTTQVHLATPTPSPPPRQENGVVEELLPHNEPEENQYESPCQSSLGDHEVLVNVVHVSEPPSIQNQDGQTPSMLGNVNLCETKPIQNNNSEPEIAIESPSSVSLEFSHSCEVNQGEKVVGNGASMLEGPQLHILKGQATTAFAMEPNFAPELPATAVRVSFNAASNENRHPSESRAAEVLLELKPQYPVEEKPSSSVKLSHTKYFMTAAGVVIFAIMAWKLKR